MVHWRSRESDNILKGYKLDIQVIYPHHPPHHRDGILIIILIIFMTFSPDDDRVKGPPFNPELGVQIHALQKGIFDEAYICVHICIQICTNEFISTQHE